MRYSLHSHLLYLENRIQLLSDRLTKPGLSSAEVAGLEQQIALAELALEHYRKAYALEVKVSRPEPSGSPGNEPSGGIGAPGSSASKKKRDGDAAIAVRTRKRTRSLADFAAVPRQSSGRVSCFADRGSERRGTSGPEDSFSSRSSGIPRIGFPTLRIESCGAAGRAPFAIGSSRLTSRSCN